MSIIWRLCPLPLGLLLALGTLLLIAPRAHAQVPAEEWVETIEQVAEQVDQTTDDVYACAFDTVVHDFSSASLHSLQSTLSQVWPGGPSGLWRTWDTWATVSPTVCYLHDRNAGAPDDPGGDDSGAYIADLDMLAYWAQLVQGVYPPCAAALEISAYVTLSSPEGGAERDVSLRAGNAFVFGGTGALIGGGDTGLGSGAVEIVPTDQYGSKLDACAFGSGSSTIDWVRISGTFVLTAMDF